MNNLEKRLRNIKAIRPDRDLREFVAYCKSNHNAIMQGLKPTATISEENHYLKNFKRAIVANPLPTAAELQAHLRIIEKVELGPKADIPKLPAITQSEDRNI